MYLAIIYCVSIEVYTTQEYLHNSSACIIYGGLYCNAKRFRDIYVEVMLFVHQSSVHPVHLDSMRLTCITCMGAASYLLGVH